MITDFYKKNLVNFFFAGIMLPRRTSKRFFAGNKLGLAIMAKFTERITSILKQIISLHYY